MEVYVMEILNEWKIVFENWFTKMLYCNWMNGYVIDVLMVEWFKNDKMAYKMEIGLGSCGGPFASLTRSWTWFLGPNGDLT